MNKHTEEVKEFIESEIKKLRTTNNSKLKKKVTWKLLLDKYPDVLDALKKEDYGYAIDRLTYELSICIAEKCAQRFGGSFKDYL